MDTRPDYNVSHYTLSELLDMVKLTNDYLTPRHIQDTIGPMIQKNRKTNPDLSLFLIQVQGELTRFSQGLQRNEAENADDEEEYDEDDEDEESENKVEGFQTAEYPSGEKQVNEWYKNQTLTQTNNPTQTDKITQRKQKVGIFGNQHMPMKQEQLATTDTYTLPVKQDGLNPNLKNTITRFVNLDSQYRQYSNGTDGSSTDYTLDLSDTLNNVLKLSIYSYQIPFCWYAIDDSIGNTCLWVVINESSLPITVAVSVPAGNYTATGFTNALNTAFNTAFNTALNTTTVTDWIPVSYNANNGKITLSLDKGIYTDPDTGAKTTMSPETTTLIFYDFSDTLQCVNTCASKNDRFFNGTLGWLMGYRLPYMAITAEGNEASSIIDLNGTKYLLLVIDDYNQNHVNNSLVSITQFNNTLKMPSFYSPDIPYTCVTPAQRGNNLAQLMQSIDNEDSAQNGLMIGDKYSQSYKTTQQLLPSAPRTLTKAQLYAANEITQNRATMTSHLSKAPTSSDIFAIIPIKTSVGVPTGSLLVEFSGSLQDSCRTYFGPVNIERMAVRLLDDKGRVLNLHGTDWCVTLVCECLYQY